VNAVHTSEVDITNRYYTGQRKVTNDSPIYNYNARYYNPDIGIFIQPDSVEGPNRYAYVGGNPIMKNDPSGNMSTDTAGSPDQRNILQKAFEMITGADQYPVYANNPKNITQQLQQSLARVDAATGLVSVGSYLEYGARTGGSATGLGGLLLKAIMSYQQIDFNDGIIASSVNFGKQYISRDENTGLFLAGAVMPGANEWKLERISQIPPGQMRLFRGVKSAALQTEFLPALDRATFDSFQAVLDRMGYEGFASKVDEAFYLRHRAKFYFGGKPKHYTGLLEEAKKYAEGGAVFYLDIPETAVMRFYKETMSGVAADVYEIPFNIASKSCKVFCTGSGVSQLSKLRYLFGR